MTTGVVIERATAADDAAIRALLRASSVPGEVTLSFRREPAYRSGDTVLGHEAVTLVARDSGSVVAVASAALREVHLHGVVTTVAYLSGVRVAASHQGRMLVARGLATMRALLRERGVPGALAAITLGNRAAERLLIERPARDASGFTPIAALRTLVFPAAQAWPVARRPAHGVRVERADDAAAVLAFMARHGPRRELFPVVRDEHLRGALPGLSLDDVLVARSDGGIVGTLAAWDQSAVRQTVVVGYGQRLRRLKPLLDLARRARGALALPAEGDALHTHYGTWLCVRDDDDAVARALLRAAVRRAADARAHVLTLTLAETDPLLAPLARLRHVAYRSRLTVLPLADRGFAQRLEGTVHVDAGRL